MQTKSHVRLLFSVPLLTVKHMFCHFIIHSQFEHSLSHSRANGSPSEEPDSALSDDLTVRIAAIRSNNNSSNMANNDVLKSQTLRNLGLTGS